MLQGCSPVEDAAFDFTREIGLPSSVLRTRSAHWQVHCFIPGSKAKGNCKNFRHHVPCKMSISVEKCTVGWKNEPRGNARPQGQCSSVTWRTSGSATRDSCRSGCRRRPRATREYQMPAASALNIITELGERGRLQRVCSTRSTGILHTEVNRVSSFRTGFPRQTGYPIAKVTAKDCSRVMV